MRFWTKVDVRGPDECWPWNGRLTEKGYGKYDHGGKHWRAHRFALLALGKDLGENIVMHACDNPPCCNPAHLALGTRADNNADMRAKGRERHAYGVQIKNSKLTPEIVRQIRASTEALSALAVRFGVVQSVISKARSGKTWRHVQ